MKTFTEGVFAAAIMCGLIVAFVSMLGSLFGSF